MIQKAKQELLPIMDGFTETFSEFIEDNELEFTFSGSSLMNAFHGFKQTDLDVFVWSKKYDKFPLIEKFNEKYSNNNHTSDYSHFYIETKTGKYDIIFMDNTTPENIVEAFDFQHAKWYTLPVKDSWETDGAKYHFIAPEIVRFSIENKYLIPTNICINNINSLLVTDSGYDSVITNIGEMSLFEYSKRVVYRVNKFRRRGMVFPKSSSFPSLLKTAKKKIKELEAKFPYVIEVAA